MGYAIAGEYAVTVMHLTENLLYYNIYLAAGLFNTGTFTSIHQAPTLIQQALNIVEGIESMQLANRGKITGQGSYGNLSSVCRGATKLLAVSWTQLAAHFFSRFLTYCSIDRECL